MILNEQKCGFRKNVTQSIDNPVGLGYNANGQKCGFRIFGL